MKDASALARKITQECPAFRVRQASRVLSKLYDDELAPAGIQLSQLPVVCALAIFGDKGATMSRLAQVLVMDRTTLSRNLRPLERAGLLRVARSPDDARTKIVVITRAGEGTVEKVFAIWARVVRRVKKALGEDTLAQLLVNLDRVIALSPGSERGGPPPTRRARVSASEALD